MGIGLSSSWMGSWVLTFSGGAELQCAPGGEHLLVAAVDTSEGAAGGEGDVS